MNDAFHRTTGHRLPVHFWKPIVFAIAIECPAAFEKPASQTKRLRHNLSMPLPFAGAHPIPDPSVDDRR
jgi:hypothetical protein